MGAGGEGNNFLTTFPFFAQNFSLKARFLLSSHFQEAHPFSRRQGGGGDEQKEELQKLQETLKPHPQLLKTPSPHPQLLETLGSI